MLLSIFKDYECWIGMKMMSDLNLELSDVVAVLLALLSQCCHLG